MGNPVKYIVSDWLSIQNFNMDIYNKQVFSSVSSVHVPQFVLEHLFIDSYKIEDNPQKSEKTKKKQLKIKIKKIKETAIKNQKGEEHGRTGR